MMNYEDLTYDDKQNALEEAFQMMKLNEQVKELEEENKRYREAIEKAIEEEEQNLEGYQSIVHRVLADALESGKNDG